MRIDLDRDLAPAARDDHDPSRPDAGHLAEALARDARRRGLRWLAAALALALAVGFLAWYRPRLGSAPTPTPTPSPSAWAWHWDPDGALDQPLPDAEVARRCHLQRTERIVDDGSPRTAGQSLSIVPASWKGSPSVLPKQARTCYLGFQHTPVARTVTRAETTGSATTLLATCARHSGFDPTDGDWHVWPGIVRGARASGTMDLTTVAWTNDDGWIALCTLAADQDVAWLDVHSLAEQLQTPCLSLHVFPAGDDDSGTVSSYTATSVEAFDVAPVPTVGTPRADPSITSLDLVVDPPRSVTITGIPVVDGLAGVQRRVPLPHPMHVSDGMSLTGYTVRMHDASGKVVRTCHAGGN